MGLGDRLVSGHVRPVGVPVVVRLEPTGQIQGTKPVDERVRPSPQPPRDLPWWPQLGPTGPINGHKAGVREGQAVTATTTGIIAVSVMLRAPGR
jgi:hypothetical protein